MTNLWPALALLSLRLPAEEPGTPPGHEAGRQSVVQLADRAPWVHWEKGWRGKSGDTYRVETTDSTHGGRRGGLATVLVAVVSPTKLSDYWTQGGRRRGQIVPQLSDPSDRQMHWPRDGQGTS